GRRPLRAARAAAPRPGDVGARPVRAGEASVAGDVARPAAGARQVRMTRGVVVALVCTLPALASAAPLPVPERYELLLAPGAGRSFTGRETIDAHVDAPTTVLALAARSTRRSPTASSRLPPRTATRRATAPICRICAAPGRPRKRGAFAKRWRISS